MKRNEGNLPDGIVYLNFKTPDSATLTKATELPTLIPEETFNVLREGDQNQEPLLVTEAIDFPVEGSGGVYTKEFFQSFLNRLKVHVFGGNKLGHSWPERDDFFTIGGKINTNQDGKTGTVYLKIYIPSFGFETTNSGFIRNVKAKNVHYSLVTYPQGELRKGDDGEYKMHFVESIGYERNDAVPFEGGAMKQRVNASEVQKINFELARELIKNGNVSRDDNGEEFLVNGKVSRPMLRRLVANADCERKSEIGELISMIDKRKNGGRPVELKEAIEMVKNAAANGAVNLAELVKNCGAEKLMRNADDDAKIALANSLTAKLGDKPVETLDLTPADRLILARLDKAMSENEVWRGEDLSIGSLAALVGAPEHRLRKLINGTLGHRNFADYVNGRRIEAAKTALADPEQALKSVSTIAYELGFGSLGPFNRAFRAAVGVTPTAWRQQATPPIAHLRLVETGQTTSKADKRA